MENVYIGIDYSSRNTGVCILSNSGEYLCSYLIQPKSKIFDDRIIEIYDVLNKILISIKNPYIGIESPSFFSKGKTIDIAAGYGYIKYNLIKKGYDILSITPSQLKKFATGSGRATKEDIWGELPDDVKNDFLSSSYKKYDDLADAYFIARYIYEIGE